jgi:multiple sugar transport system permease protein
MTHPAAARKSSVERSIRITRKTQDTLFALALILPAFIILALVIFAPIARGIWMSFMDYTLATRNNPTWNDFENYRKLFASGEIFIYFKNTIVFVASVVTVEVVIGMIVALLLNTQIVARNVFRALFFLPWTIPSVVVALLFSWMLQPQYGVLNYLFVKAGIIDSPLVWTQHPQLAMVSIVAAAAWRLTPMMIVMFLAGLQSIPNELMEAARIDGANDVQVFRRVMLPLLTPVIATTVLISIINNFQQFTIIYNMTAGGPIDRTTTLSIATYSKAFTQFNMGLGSAIGVLWLAALVFFTVFYNRRFERNNFAD